VRGAGIHDFRRWLKASLCTYGPKVIDAYEHTTAKVSHCRTAQAVRTTQARRGEVKMDMSQYSGGAFLKIGDVKVNGPLRVVIDDIQLGKYGRPDVSFTDGSKLSINVTNKKALCNAYGTESGGWVGKEIELSLGEVEFQGEPQESILVKPISPPIENKPPPKPKSRRRGDMDDEIAF
jgi:hypothetical protein